MTFLRRLVSLIAILAVPVSIHAQEAVLTGTVTDSTGGVLPASRSQLSSKPRETVSRP
jgi:hypothetical protein